MPDQYQGLCNMIHKRTGVDRSVKHFAGEISCSTYTAGTTTTSCSTCTIKPSRCAGAFFLTLTVRKSSNNAATCCICIDYNSDAIADEYRRGICWRTRRQPTITPDLATRARIIVSAALVKACWACCPYHCRGNGSTANRRRSNRCSDPNTS